MTAWYVYADRQHGAYRLPLLGPFERMRQAAAMLEPVRAAVQRMRPDLADCDIRVGPLDWKRGGSLDLTIAVDALWIKHCIEWRVR